MSSSASQHIAELFGHVLHGDNVVRKRAERDLGEQREKRGTCDALCAVAHDASLPPPIRQLAIITLKNWISARDWSYDRAAVHGTLMGVLCDPSAGDLALRTCGVAIAKTAVLDYPEHWPTLLDDLVSLLPTQHNKFAILAICCLTEELSGTALQSMALLVGGLLQTATEVDHQSAALILKAVDALCLSVGVAHPQIRQALETSFEVLQEQAMTQVSEENVHVVLQSLHIVQKIFQEFPKLWNEDILMQLMSLLTSEAPVFEQSVIFEGDDDEWIVGVSKVAARRLDLLLCVAKSRKLAGLCKKTLAAHSMALVDLLLQYAPATHANEIEWCSDANAFQKQEEDRVDGLSWAPRDIAAECVQALVKRIGGLSFTEALMARCGAVMAEDISSPRWKMRESVLFVLHHVVHYRMPELVTIGAHHSFPTLIDLLLANDLGGPGYEVPSLLPARALLLMADLLVRGRANAAFEEDAATRLGHSLLPAAIGALTSEDLLIASCSCKLVAVLTRKILPAPQLGQYNSSAIDALLAMSVRQDGVHGETLYGALEVLCAWLKRCPVVDEKNLAIPSRVLHAWELHMQDPNVGELVQTIFLIIFRRVDVYERALMETLPSMAGILQGHASMTAMCCIPSLLAIIRGMVRSGSLELVESLRALVLGRMCQLVLTNEDTGIAQEALRVLASLLRRVEGNIAEATVDVTPSSLDINTDGLSMLDEQPEPVPLPHVLLSVARLIVSEGRSEMFLFSAGSFLREIARVLPPCLSHEEIADFVSAVSHRALTVRTDSALQELLLPLAALISHYPTAVVDVLGEALVPLMEKWISHQAHFFGPQVILETGRALLRLLEACPQAARELMLMLPTNSVTSSAASTGRRGGADRHGKPRRVPATLETALFVGAGKALAQLMVSKRSMNRDGGDDDDDDDDDDDGEDDDVVAAAAAEHGSSDSDAGGKDVNATNERSSDDDESGEHVGIIDEDGDEDATGAEGAQHGEHRPQRGDAAVAEFEALLPFVGNLAPVSLEFFTAAEQRRLNQFVRSRTSH